MRAGFMAWSRRHSPALARLLAVVLVCTGQLNWTVHAHNLAAESPTQAAMPLPAGPAEHHHHAQAADDCETTGQVHVHESPGASTAIVTLATVADSHEPAVSGLPPFSVRQSPGPPLAPLHRPPIG